MKRLALLSQWVMVLFSRGGKCGEQMGEDEKCNFLKHGLHCVCGLCLCSGSTFIFMHITTIIHIQVQISNVIDFFFFWGGSRKKISKH